MQTQENEEMFGLCVPVRFEFFMLVKEMPRKDQHMHLIEKTLCTASSICVLVKNPLDRVTSLIPCYLLKIVIFS